MHADEAAVAGAAEQRPPQQSPAGDKAAARGEARVPSSSEPGTARGAEGSCLRGPRLPRSRRRQVRTYWRLKTQEEYERDEDKKEPIPKKFFDFKSLEQMIEHLPYKDNMSRRALAEDQERRLCFHQFLRGVLQISPDERWTPKQAAESPFVSGGPYEPNWQVPDDEPVPSFATMSEGTAKSSTLTAAIGRGAGDVPRLRAAALGA